MTVKLTGADYKAFLEDASVWKEGYWFESDHVTVNGEEVGDDYDETTLDDADKVTITGGCLYLGSDIGAESIDYEKRLRKWLKARTVTTVVLEINNDQLENHLASFAVLPGVKVLRK